MSCWAITVTLLQISTWFILAGIFMHKGVVQLMDAHGSYVHVVNDTYIHEPGYFSKQKSGFILIGVSLAALVVGSSCLFMKIIECCWRKQTFTKVSNEDRPPRYEDVMIPLARNSKKAIIVKSTVV